VSNGTVASADFEHAQRTIQPTFSYPMDEPGSGDRIREEARAVRTAVELEGDRRAERRLVELLEKPCRDLAAGDEPGRLRPGSLPSFVGGVSSALCQGPRRAASENERVIERWIGSTNIEVLLPKLRYVVASGHPACGGDQLGVFGGRSPGTMKRVDRGYGHAVRLVA
jgi:hypothetical protein